MGQVITLYPSQMECQVLIIAHLERLTTRRRLAVVGFLPHLEPMQLAALEFNYLATLARVSLLILKMFVLQSLRTEP